MSAVVILQETPPFDFEAGTSLYNEEDRLADQELCKGYLSRWAGAFGSGRQAAQPVTFGELRSAARRLAQ
ncbi:hypothetical protein ACWD3Z_33480 [Streptomyces sp. NPDC002740]